MDELSDYGIVKRADFKLRTKYYGLKTKIFLIQKSKYAIQILTYIDLYEEIKKDFDNAIRPASCWIEIVTEEPKIFITEVAQLLNIASQNQGILLTSKEFKSILISKFANVDFLDIHLVNRDGLVVIISVAMHTDDAEIRAIKEFVENLKIGFTQVLVKKANMEKANLPLIYTDVNLACTDKRFEFSKMDSEFWFNNVEKIYSGKINKNDLRFFNSKKTKCFMDFSVWNNENINIRSNALLYDTIYLSFPLKESMDKFLSQQHLKKEDLEELVARNKLVILLPNTESRYDKEIIDRLFKINNNSVVSKRGINALMAIFYCDLEKRYKLFWQDNEDVLEFICRETLRHSDEITKELYKQILWPMNVKIKSYELLTTYGPLTLSSIGVNRLLTGFLRDTKKDKNIEFEMTINSSNIHIATALQATYFPFATSDGKGGIYSDNTVSNILASVLNIYQYPAAEQQQSIMSYGEQLERERKNIYLLQTDNSVLIKHILDYGKKYSTTTTLKNILENLSTLDQEQQHNKIAEYNNLIAEIGKENISLKKIPRYVLSAMEFVPGAGKIATAFNLAYELANITGIKRRFIKKKFESGQAEINDEVYILDKISRVAKILQ